MSPGRKLSGVDSIIRCESTDVSCEQDELLARLVNAVHRSSASSQFFFGC